MTWVQSILDDESIFPSRVGKNQLTADSYPLFFRRTFPEELPRYRQADLQEALPSVRTHLLLALSQNRELGRRGALEYVLQALLLFHMRI